MIVLKIGVIDNWSRVLEKKEGRKQIITLHVSQDVVGNQMLPKKRVILFWEFPANCLRSFHADFASAPEWGSQRIAVREIGK